MICTDRERETCNVEKMGCNGCYYNTSDIKVGEYVRTKEGYIAKLLNFGINEGIDGITYLFDGSVRDISTLVIDESNFLWDDELANYITKHSKNIIDLVEDGDIVEYQINSLLGTEIREVKKYRDARSRKEYLDVEGFGLEQITILKILTHEQFEQNAYKVV